MSLRHPGQNPGHGQGYLSQDSHVVPPPGLPAADVDQQQHSLSRRG